MIATSEFKKGVRLSIDGDPFVILETQTHAPTARGGNTLLKIKVRNLRTGQVLDKSIRAGERFEQPDVERRSLQYLYADGDALVFMDTASYDQLSVPAQTLGERVRLLSDGLQVKALFFEGRVLDLELPLTVEFAVTEVEPGTKGDTVAGSATKGARLSNGMQVQVPLFIKAGDVIRLYTADGRFAERAR